MHAAEDDPDNETQCLMPPTAGESEISAAPRATASAALADDEPTRSDDDERDGDERAHTKRPDDDDNEDSGRSTKRVRRDGKENDESESGGFEGEGTDGAQPSLQVSLADTSQAWMYR